MTPFGCSSAVDDSDFDLWRWMIAFREGISRQHFDGPATFFASLIYPEIRWHLHDVRCIAGFLESGTAY